MDYYMPVLESIQLRLPLILNVVLLLLIGWLVATIVKKIITNVALRLHVPHVDKQTASSLGNIGYWLIWLLVLPMILQQLNLNSVLLPFQNMLDTLLGYLPNILAAGLIVFVGLLAARIVKELVISVSRVSQVDTLPRRLNVDTNISLSNVFGQIVQIVIIVPVAISALETLQIDSITAPAVSMLHKVLDAVPNILTAAFMVIIGVFVGRFVKNIVVNLLESLDFNGLIAKTGVRLGARPSQIVGSLVMIAIVLLLTLEAANILQFTQLTLLLTMFIDFAGELVIAILMMLIGLAFANKAADMIRGSSVRLALAAKVAILVFVAGLSLDYTGLAPAGFVATAFNLLIAAVAIAIAIAFGLGGREPAKKVLEKYVQDSRIQ